MLDFISKGGVLVIPIGLCSVVALAVFLERLIVLWRVKRKGRGLLEELLRLTREKRLTEASELAASSGVPLGRLFAELIAVDGCTAETRQEAIREAYAQESRRLASRLQLLATIANIAPLLGLLGTITGMIRAFMVIQQTGGKVDASALAGGIWEAMLTTALGLAVALPVMMAHSYLVSRVEAQSGQLKQGVVAYLKETTAP